MISDDTESSIKILLESRTANDVAETDISEWREKLREVDKMADIWLVGSENLARFAETKNFSRLYVAENIELEKREISLKIKSASGAEKQTILELRRRTSAQDCSEIRLKHCRKLNSVRQNSTEK